MKVVDVQKDLKKLSSKKDIEILQRFFKTGKGEYGEGDIFLGVRVPEQRKIVKKYQDLDLKNIEELIHSKIHEHRLTGLLILVEKFKKADKKLKKQIYRLYLKNARRVNNWDLIDLTAPKIIGAYLFENKNEKDILVKLANSKNLWEKRISILATFYFIYQGKQQETFKISKILLNDKHDLIHKAVGWMLREVGKRIGQEIEESFLKKYYQKMPRTMLRYAIERFPEKLRKKYLLGKV